MALPLLSPLPLKLWSTTPPLLKPRSTCFPRCRPSRPSSQAMDRAEPWRLAPASCRGCGCLDDAAAAALRTAAADRRRRAAVVVNMLLLGRKAWPCWAKSDDATTNAASLRGMGRSLLSLRQVALIATQRRTRFNSTTPAAVCCLCCLLSAVCCWLESCDAET